MRNSGIAPTPEVSGVYHENVEFRVLGSLEVVQDGSPVSLGGAKQRTVLALLLASSGRSVSTDRLIEGVYGGEAPEGVRRSIQTFVSNLRGLLSGTIERRGNGYLARIDRGALDALRFEDAVAQARLDEDPKHAAELLRSSLDLWHGHPYADIDAYGLLEPEIARLNELRISALGSRIDADLAAGRHAAIASEIASLSAEHPLREHFRAQHMVALYRSGRQAEALRACDMTRSYLAEEIGIGLSEELRDLEQRILEQDPSLAYQTSTEVRRIAVLAADVADWSSLASLDLERRRSVIEAQERVINRAAADRAGRVFAHRGSAIYASFPTVQSAVDAAAIIQQDLTATGLQGVSVATAIDIGDVEVGNDGDIAGPPVTRTAALVGAAHAGQMLLSAEAHHALTDDGAPGWMIRGLGQHHLEGLGSSQVVYQLVLPGRTADFPELRSDARSAPLPRAARAIQGYELRDEIGSGPVGTVHRAYQSSVGREVAIKIIQPLWANQPEFLRRFEVEAQLVARMEHPHIVPLYDYWRDPSGAFLVMRWMRGGTLDQRLADGPLTVEETRQLLSELGSALAAAHRNGVIHGDVKPTNVLFDEEGNAYLSDFGITMELSGSLHPKRQVEGYGANDETPCIRCDVGALALVLYRCLSGSAPHELASNVGDTGKAASLIPPAIDESAGIPPQIVAVLRHATAVQHDDRYADANELISAWESALGATGDDGDATLHSDARNPYKGLRPFDEPDADDFYGRERIIAQLADAVGADSIVAVVGPSGIGKSSVVKAGLIPALRRGVISGSDEWLITTMTPDHNAFGELAAALTRVSVTTAVDLEESLRSDPLSLVRNVRELLPPDTPLLLVIDQFEELFTVIESEDDRIAFLDLLVGTATARDGMVRVVLTMRADFMDRPLQYADFGELLRGGVVLISTPNDNELRAIVEEPARAVGVRFEGGLVDRIVNDVQGQPGGLPLLEFSLAELFDHRDTDLLTLSAYDDVGGVPGALGRRAEDLYRHLDPESRETARQLFLRLVTVHETGRTTRRRVSITEIHRLGIGDDAVSSVLDAFGRHRILTFDRDPVTRTPTVEVAHEAILSEWDRLDSWIEEHRDDLLLHRRLTAAITEWKESDRDPGYLVSGGRLEHFESWVAATDMVIADSERELLTASRSQDDEKQARRLRRRRWILTGFAGAAIIAIVLAVAALYQSSLRASEAAVSHANELASAAMANLDSDPELSILLALEGLAVTPEPQREAIEALHAAVLASRSESLIGWPDGVPFVGNTALTATPNGTVAVSGDGGPIVLHNGTTGSYVGVLEPDSPAPSDWTIFDVPKIDANPVTGEIAAVYGDRVLRVWDPESGQLVWSANTAQDLQATDLPPAAGSVVYSPDGQWLVVTTHDSPTWTLSVWDTTTRDRLWVQQLAEPQGPVWASFSPSGDELAIAWWFEFDSATGKVVVLDSATGTELRRVDPGAPIGAIAWSPDGTQIFNGTESGALMVWTADSLEQVTVRTEHSGSVDAIEFSSDGTLLATSGAGSITIWATDPLDPVLTLATSVAPVSLAFAPDNSRLFTAEPDGVVRVWNITPEGIGELMAAAPSGGIYGVDVDAAGENVIAHSAFGRFDPGGITVWDAATAGLVYGVDGLDDFAFGGVTYLSKGERFAVQDFDERTAKYGAIQVRDAADGAVLIDLEESYGFDRQQLTESPDGRYLASGGTSDQPDDSGGHGSVSVYDLESGRLIHRLSHSDLMVTGTAFSPDGKLLATGTCVAGSLRIWDWEGEALLQEVEHSDCITRAAFSPTAPLVAVSGFGASTLVWDVDAGHEAYTLAGNPADAYSVTFSPDGTRIATAGIDGTMRVWDAVDGSELLAVPISSAGLGDVAFFPDGDSVAVSSIDGNLWVIALDTDDLVDIAQDRVMRTLTAGECARYHIASCPET